MNNFFRPWTGTKARFASPAGLLNREILVAHSLWGGGLCLNTNMGSLHTMVRWGGGGEGGSWV